MPLRAYIRVKRVITARMKILWWTVLGIALLLGVLQDAEAQNATKFYSAIEVPESDKAGELLGIFITDILKGTGHVDLHFVTYGLTTQGLSTVAAMCFDRFIQVEFWPDIVKFLTHLGPTEGYLSEDQFMVYGTSNDVMSIIVERREFMDVINTGITTWYYVILDDEISNQEFADSLEESSISLLLRLSKFVPGRWDTFTLMSIGDGRKIFKLVGWWTKEEGLVVTGELFPERSTSFYGRSLKVGVINKARVMELSKQGTDIVSMRGYSNELLMVLKEALNFTVDPVEFTVWGSDQGDNTWDGVIGALFRKEIHFSPMDFTPTMESRSVIDFSVWVSEDPVVITSAAPQPVVRPLLLLQIFQTEVYLTLFAVLLFSGVFIWVFRRVNQRILGHVYLKPFNRSDLAVIVYSSFKTIVAQCLKDVPEDFSTRLFLIMIWFMSIIIDSVYQGHITAFITLPRMSPAIDDYIQLSKNTSVIPITEDGSTAYTMITESDRESFRRLAERLQTKDAKFLESEEFFYGVAVGKWAIVDSQSASYGRALAYENEKTLCKFYVSREMVLGGLDAWPFPRNSPVYHQINNALKQLRYFGIIEYIKKKYYRSSCSRDLGVSAGSGAEKMDLQLQQSSFYLLIMGFILGFIAFIGELIYHKVSESKICCF